MLCGYVSPKPAQEVVLRQPENSYSLPQGLESESTASYISYNYGSVTVRAAWQNLEVADAMAIREIGSGVDANGATKAAERQWDERGQGRPSRFISTVGRMIR